MTHPEADKVGRRKVLQLLLKRYKDKDGGRKALQLLYHYLYGQGRRAESFAAASEAVQGYRSQPAGGPAHRLPSGSDFETEFTLVYFSFQNRVQTEFKQSLG